MKEHEALREIYPQYDALVDLIDKLADGKLFRADINLIIDHMVQEVKNHKLLKTAKMLPSSYCIKCGGHGFLWIRKDNGSHTKQKCDACNGTNKRIVIGNKEGYL